MPEITVTDDGYTVDHREMVTEIRCPRGLVICYAHTPGLVKGPWVVTVLPSTITPGTTDDPNADWPSFDLPSRAQAERLLKLIARLHAGQQVTA